MDNDHGFSKACPSGNHMIDGNYGKEPEPETDEIKQCVHCEHETYCKLYDEICNGYMESCPDYEVKQ